MTKIQSSCRCEEAIAVEGRADFCLQVYDRWLNLHASCMGNEPSEPLGFRHDN
jgi:hypothetical protein